MTRSFKSSFSLTKQIASEKDVEQTCVSFGSFYKFAPFGLLRLAVHKQTIKTKILQGE